MLLNLNYLHWRSGVGRHEFGPLFFLFSGLHTLPEIWKVKDFSKRKEKIVKSKLEDHESNGLNRF